MLEKSTANTGVNLSKSCYHTLMQMLLQWRHLKLLKRGGRGHEATGAAGTKEGELAIPCPSCPHPGINLPNGWEKSSQDDMLLYVVILCMDTNFCLKNQMVSNFSVNPGLGIGLLYMISRQPYEAYVLEQATQDDIGSTPYLGNFLLTSFSQVSTCVGFAALAKANTQFFQGL